MVNTNLGLFTKSSPLSYHDTFGSRIPGLKAQVSLPDPMRDVNNNNVQSVLNENEYKKSESL